MSISKSDFITLMTAYRPVTDLLEKMYGRKRVLHRADLCGNNTRLLNGLPKTWTHWHGSDYQVVYLCVEDQETVRALDDAYGLPTEWAAISLIEETLKSFAQKRPGSDLHGDKDHTLCVVSVRHNGKTEVFFGTYTWEYHNVKTSRQSFGSTEKLKSKLETLSLKIPEKSGFGPQTMSPEGNDLLATFYDEVILQFMGRAWQSAFSIGRDLEYFKTNFPAQWVINKNHFEAQIHPQICVSYRYNTDGPPCVHVHVDFGDKHETNRWHNIRRIMYKIEDIYVKWRVGDGVSMLADAQSEETLLGFLDSISSLPPWAFEGTEISLRNQDRNMEGDVAAHKAETQRLEKETQAHEKKVAVHEARGKALAWKHDLHKALMGVVKTDQS